LRETGVYQIYCKAIEQDGIGDLYKKYEELKLKLEKEGFFKEEHKHKIPYMPKVIGVLTSQDRFCCKRHNKCSNKKKSKCMYKNISSTSTRKRSRRKNCRCNLFNE
jgi:exodeoxyribonuclease VII large subunit